MQIKKVSIQLVTVLSLLFFTGCGGGGDNTPPSAQNQPDAKAKSLATISKYAQDDTAPAPTIEDYQNVGATGVTTENIDDINFLVASMTSEQVDTNTEVQQLLVDREEALDLLTHYAHSQGGTTPPTEETYQAAGVIGVNSQNLLEINTLIAGLVADDVDSGQEVHGIVKNHTPNTPKQNHAPIANSQSVTTNINTSVDITLAGSDVDADIVNYSIVSNPSHGMLSGTAPNLLYIPTSNYSGPDSFSFKVNDGKVDSTIATIILTINSNINGEITKMYFNQKSTLLSYHYDKPELATKGYDIKDNGKLLIHITPFDGQDRSFKLHDKFDQSLSCHRMVIEAILEDDSRVIGEMKAFGKNCSGVPEDKDNEDYVSKEVEYTYTDDQCTIFIATDGDDSNDGKSINKPLHTLETALGRFNYKGELQNKSIAAEYGDVICIRGGVYRESNIRPYFAQGYTGKTGKPQENRDNRRLAIRNYNNEKVIFKGSVVVKPNAMSDGKPRWEQVDKEKNVWKMNYIIDSKNKLIDADTGLPTYTYVQQVFATPKNEYDENTTSNYENSSFALIGRLGYDRYFGWGVGKYNVRVGPNSSLDATDLYENTFKTVKTKTILRELNTGYSREIAYLTAPHVRFPNGKQPSDYVIEISRARYIFDLTNFPYIDIQGLTFMHSNSSAIIKTAAQGGELLKIGEHSSVSGSEFAYADFSGLILSEMAYNEIRGIRGIGTHRHQSVYNNIFHHNGAIGLSGNSGGVHVYNNEFYKNGISPYYPQWHAGAIKFTTSAWGLIENNYIHDEYANGIWFDYASTFKGTKLDGNENTRPNDRNVTGSDAACIRKIGNTWERIINPVENNLAKAWKIKPYPDERYIEIKGNYLHKIGIPAKWNDPMRTQGLYGMGIFMEASENVKVHENLVIDTIERGIFLSTIVGKAEVYNNIVVGSHTQQIYISSKLRGKMAVPMKIDVHDNLFYNNKRDIKSWIYSYGTPQFRNVHTQDFLLESGWLSQNQSYKETVEFISEEYGLDLISTDCSVATKFACIEKVDRKTGDKTGVIDYSFLGKNNYLRNNLFYDQSKTYNFILQGADSTFVFKEDEGLQIKDNRKIQNDTSVLSAFDNISAIALATEKEGIDYKTVSVLDIEKDIEDKTPPVIGIALYDKLLGDSRNIEKSKKPKYGFVSGDRRLISLHDLVCGVPNVTKFHWDLKKDGNVLDSGDDFYKDQVVFPGKGNFFIDYTVVAEDCNGNTLDKQVSYEYRVLWDKADQ